MSVGEAHCERVNWEASVSTSSSLNVRAILKEAVARSGMTAPHHAVSGLNDSAKALYVAAAANALPRGVVLHVVPGDRQLEQAVRDVSFFVAALEGLSDAAADRAVLSFPSNEVDPYRGMTPHVGVSSARARALHALARGTARVIVASAAALLPRVSEPSRLMNAALDLRPGQDISPTDLGELLVDAGFRREDPADEHGEFAVRGGILDVFPPLANEPVRLEFIGDTIESLRTYDPATQRSVQAVDQLSIVPLSDVLGDNREGSLFSYLSRVSDVRIVVSEPEETVKALEHLHTQMRQSYATATGRAADSGEEDWVDDEGWDDEETDGEEPDRARKTSPKVRTSNGRKVLTAPSAVPDAEAAPRRRAAAARSRPARFVSGEQRPPSELFLDLDEATSRLRSARAGRNTVLRASSGTSAIGVAMSSNSGPTRSMTGCSRSRSKP